jgi:hypothetical protein
MERTDRGVVVVTGGAKGIGAVGQGRCPFATS